MLRSRLALLMILVAAPAYAGSRAVADFTAADFTAEAFMRRRFSCGGGGFHGGGFHGGGVSAFHRGGVRARGFFGGYGYGYNCGFGFDCGVYDYGTAMARRRRCGKCRQQRRRF